MTYRLRYVYQKKRNILTIFYRQLAKVLENKNINVNFYPDSAVGEIACVDRQESELVLSQETLSAYSDQGDSQKTIPYTDDVGFRIRLMIFSLIYGNLIMNIR